MKQNNQNSNKQIIFWIGVLSLLLSLVCIPDKINMSVFCLIVSIICFNYSKEEFKSFFINPTIKNIIKASRNKRRLEKEIVLLNKQKNEIDTYMTNKQQYLTNIRKHNEILKNLLLKERNLNRNIIILKDEEQELKSKINYKEEITKEIVQLEEKIALLSKQINSLNNKKENLKKEIRQNEEKSNFISIANIEYIDSLDGIEFEKFIMKLLKYLDFDECYTTSETGDYGIDVIGIKNNVKYAIQCKNYINPVGNKAIQEAYSGKDYYDCNVAIVVTNNYFTSNAINQAQKNKVVLWNRDDLLEIIKSIK